MPRTLASLNAFDSIQEVLHGDRAHDVTPLLFLLDLSLVAIMPPRRLGSPVRQAQRLEVLKVLPQLLLVTPVAAAQPACCLRRTLLGCQGSAAAGILTRFKNA